MGNTQMAGPSLASRISDSAIDLPRSVATGHRQDGGRVAGHSIPGCRPKPVFRRLNKTLRLAVIAIREASAYLVQTCCGMVTLKAGQSYIELLSTRIEARPGWQVVWCVRPIRDTLAGSIGLDPDLWPCPASALRSQIWSFFSQGARACSKAANRPQFQ